ncbi:hypothetical protein IWQ60_009390 [Tieghemiomyces parasiticus]|uniref:Protein YIP n=1 Tax=Tieghemiomyces parasiticus TaxID=78921 RepID=A0A9W8DQ77_9FUNG|nr:hypothetical protein IWQ60_009390 [Tieghemiomyces parasiticus]
MSHYPSPAAGHGPAYAELAVETDDAPAYPPVSGRLSAAPATDRSPYAADPALPSYGNTLDEPVLTTILRDLTNIWAKLSQVLLPRQRDHALRDWDLWGPLVLCLSLAIIMSLQAPNQQSAAVFTGVFVIVWVGAAVVTLNSKLLGGKISFFQSVCVLGYCVFPLNVAGLVTLFVKILLVRVILAVVAVLWATYAAVGFLADAHLPNRRLLALYPIYLFFFVIGWIILIS